MNDPNELLEQELRGLRPASPPEHLAVALGRALDSAPAAGGRAFGVPLPPAVKFSLWASWSITALAAAFALVVGLRQIDAADRARAAGQPATPSASPVASMPSSDPSQADAASLRLQPIASGGYLLGARDEGFVLLEDGLPARQVRYQFVDTVRLRAPGETASVSVSYPREEVRLIPVRAY